jgi:replicative DNA helicase Mcm
MNPLLDDGLREELVEFFELYYSEEVSSFIQGFPRDVRSVTISYQDLSTANYDLAEDYLSDRSQVNQWLRDALCTYVNELPVDLEIDSSDSAFDVRVTDLPETECYGVGELRSSHATRFVGITGQLSNVTGARTRITEAAFECVRCGAVNRLPQSFGEFQEPGDCQSCDREGPYNLDHSRSEHVDQVACKIKQPPDEAASSGGQGQEIDVYLERDLTELRDDRPIADFAGERVTINGQLTFDDTDLQGKNPTPIVGTYLRVESVELEDGSIESVNVAEHRETFTELAGHEDVHELLRDSIAPGLYANEDLETVLDAAVLYLFGGYRKDPSDGPTYRGDIHMLMVGDPSTAKSTIASNVNDLSPRSEFVSGTDVSGPGLTAAAVQEDFGFDKSQWTLKPGVLPKANHGHAIIDEIDKSDGNAAEKLHDAIEGDQQIRTSKGGIKAKLNTRCGLLASGNPAYGRFDPHVAIPEQIDLDPALVSRFDLIFELRDEVDEDLDSKISGHVLDSIQESGSMTAGRSLTPDGGVETDADDTTPTQTRTTERPVPTDVFRAWVAHARENVHPQLPDGEAKDKLQAFYNQVRSENDRDDNAAVPATTRDLMASVRLAEAAARCRLSETITTGDVEYAIDVLSASIGTRFDPDSGSLDANMVDNTVVRSQKDRIDTIKGVLSEMASDGDYPEGVPTDDLISALVDYGIDESKADHEINQLKQRGEVYEPRTGHLRGT